ncbi:cytochrome-c oxidase, cbb3-type subunit III [Neoroseomonas soli]|uniref:Cbb3-type cytochrome c oxidase subunit n=1 Tax=Neoroseomonas soli TaxID=1081025 RepID=A0A9X9WWS3_9PROT|nr:cytochrome-c oxidase, cbb3-type subunit III [Neoroseomonas soli]MBR0671602.1 cytochrome-c oxidase, cbb3-type subunit III [Neoroseomonas soli]
MSAEKHHDAEIDPVTGYETTGHDWNGIRELNTPFPRIVIWALALTFLYSVIAWVLLPAWPIGRDYTRGVLGLDQRQVAMQGFAALEKARDDWMAGFAAGDLDALAADPALMARAMPAARRLFADNCAACHGTRATGGPGFPDLTDADWLWGGSPAAIVETLRVGINSGHPDTRVSQMPAFGRDGLLPREVVQAVADYVLALPGGAAGQHHAGAQAFAENCVACHGETGSGGLGTGAPALAGGRWIYGGDRATVLATIHGGRQGVMPSWADRLSAAEINLLAVYVSRLGANGQRAEAP